ncbi:MAG TPA: HNH endonuclease signature motif containing protein [Gaiellaceae bacterium]|nr:HNH endonuclease signature motif containing protein [Gaiellaceae bacterium]
MHSRHTPRVAKPRAQVGRDEVSAAARRIWLQVHALAGVESPLSPSQQETVRLELAPLDARLTRTAGGNRAALALAAAYGGEPVVVLGFAGVRAVRAGAVSRLLAHALGLLEPWGDRARLELRSLRPAVRRELLVWSATRSDVAVAAASRRALLLVPRTQPARSDAHLSANRRRMLLLAARDGEHCVWCSTPLSHRSLDATVDHVRCRSVGGADSLENLVLACSSCNHRRSDRAAELWLQHCVASGLEVDVAAVTRAIARAERHGRRRSRPRRAAA